MKKNRIMVAILATMLIIVAILIIIFVVKNVNTSIVENHKFYQYFAGQKVIYEGTLALESRNHISQITVEEEKVQLDATPVYYLDIQNKVILPQNMAIVYPVRARSYV